MIFNGFLIKIEDKIFDFFNSKFKYSEDINHDIVELDYILECKLLPNRKDDYNLFNLIKYMQDEHRHKCCKIKIFDDTKSLILHGIFIKDYIYDDDNIILIEFNVDYSIIQIHTMEYIRKYKIERLMKCQQ